MPLTQVQIIRSLAEALAWFEKELDWNVDPAELRHLSGRIGELYAAMITRGQMALATNQHGYDVVSAAGERISVKTFTSSNHVSFKQSTLVHVDRAMILRINVDDGEASIEEVFDGSRDELVDRCGERDGVLIFRVSRPSAIAPIPLEHLAVVAEASRGEYRVLQYENGTIAVERGSIREQPAKPILRHLAAELGIGLLNSNGNKRNTRQLGAEIIAALNA